MKSIPVTPATRPAVAQALKSLRESASSFRLSPEHALHLTCDDRRLLVLLARRRAVQSMQTLLEQRTLIAVVAEQQTLEDDAWEISELVLTEPRDRRRFRIAVMTPDGRLMMDGIAESDRTLARFELCSVERPGAIPLTAAGSFSEGRLHIERIIVGTERYRPLRPTPV